MFAGEKLATLASELRLSPETLHPWNNDALIDNDPSLVKFLLLELRFLYVGQTEVGGVCPLNSGGKRRFDRPYHFFR